MYMSDPLLGKDTARKSAFMRAATRMSSLVVGQLAAVGHQGVDARPLHALHLEGDAAVVEQQFVAGAHVVGQLAIVEAHAAGIAHAALGVEHEGGAVGQGDAPAVELADANLRALQVHHDAHGAAQLAGDLAHQVGAGEVVFGKAVGEVHAHHVHARGHHGAQHRLLGGGGAQGGDDLGGALHAQAAARASRISMAGSLRPSRNSRKAPPAVEM
jgi:hypothetical protein